MSALTKLYPPKPRHESDRTPHLPENLRTRSCDLNGFAGDLGGQGQARGLSPESFGLNASIDRLLLASGATKEVEIITDPDTCGVTRQRPARESAEAKGCSVDASALESGLSINRDARPAIDHVPSRKSSIQCCIGLR